MNTTPDQVQPSSNGSKPLWAAIGALSVVVLAMASALVYVQTRPVDPRVSVVPAPKIEVAAVPPAASAPTVGGNGVAKEKHASTSGKPAPVAAKSVAGRTEKPAPSVPAAGPAAPVIADASAVPQPVAHIPKPVCLNCGTVTAVTPVEREGTPSGAGVVAGGVLGGLVGNQVGDGSGRAVATLLGAIGGGWAGNTVEKKMKKETVYQVRVRMEDGSTRMVEQTTPASVGAKVTVDGGVLRSEDGSRSTPVPPPAPAKPAAAPLSNGG